MEIETQKLKLSGLRVTPQRLKVLNLFHQARDRHLSAEAVYRQLSEQGDEIALATVYRVLTQFEAVGLVLRHNFRSGESVFEVADTEHHDHLVCIDCHRVEEFSNHAIELEQAQVAKQRGFEMTSHHLTIYGRCCQCAHVASGKK